jgi:gas vesicle protein GvpG
MILVDDLLAAPIGSVLWIFREIHHAAQEELANEADSITAELSRLYMQLETGRISEDEFAAEEKVLLERLDQLPGSGVEDEGEEEEGEDEGQGVETGAGIVAGTH